MNELAQPLTVLAVFHPPIPHPLNELMELLERLFHSDKRNNDARKLGTLEDGGLTTHQDGGTHVSSRPQGPGHNVNAVHAAGAVFIIDLQVLAVPVNAAGGTKVADLFLYVEFSRSRVVSIPVGGELAGCVRPNGLLVNPNVVTPGADYGAIGPGNGGHAVIGAAGSLEFELVGEHGTMELVLVFIGYVVGDGLSI